jgi:prolipoprotein diacylglyceryltransferase
VHAGIAYFPTPLLEGALEGAVLMIFLYFIYRKKKNIFGMTSAYFLLGY